MVGQRGQDAANNVIEFTRGGLCINIATEQLRNDGRSGSMDILSDRLDGRFINFGGLALEWNSPCTHPQSPMV